MSKYIKCIYRITYYLVNGETPMSKESSFSVTRHQFPEGVVDYIEQVTYNLPWIFFKDCAYGNFDHPLKKEMHPYFSHTFLENNIIRPNFHQMPWNKIGEFIGLPNNKMIRAHNTLQYPRPEMKDVPHNIHTDNPNPHIVGLYYPNDSDGDTFFFDDEEKWM